LLSYHVIKVKKFVLPKIVIVAYTDTYYLIVG